MNKAPAPSILITGCKGPDRYPVVEDLLDGMIDGSGSTRGAVIFVGAWIGRTSDFATTPIASFDNDASENFQEDLERFIADVVERGEAVAIIVDTIDALMARLEATTDAVKMIALKCFFQAAVMKGLSLVAMTSDEVPPPLMANLFNVVVGVRPDRTLIYDGAPWMDQSHPYGPNPLHEVDVATLGRFLLRLGREEDEQVEEKANPGPAPEAPPVPQDQGAESDARAVLEIPMDYRLKAGDVGVLERHIGLDPRSGDAGAWQNRAIAIGRREAAKGRAIEEPTQRALLKIAYNFAKTRKIGRIRDLVEGKPDVLSDGLAAIHQVGKPIGKLTPWELGDLQRAVNRILKDRAKALDRSSVDGPDEDAGWIIDLLAGELAEKRHAVQRLRIIATLAEEPMEAMEDIARARKGLKLGKNRAARIETAIRTAQNIRANVDGPEGKAIRTIYATLADIPPSRRFLTLSTFLGDLKIPMQAKTVQAVINKLDPQHAIKLGAYLSERFIGAS